MTPCPFIKIIKAVVSRIKKQLLEYHLEAALQLYRGHYWLTPGGNQDSLSAFVLPILSGICHVHFPLYEHLAFMWNFPFGFSVFSSLCM